jgi:hypothetical protein
VGKVVQSRNFEMSKLELTVRQKLEAAGLVLHKGRSAVQCDFDPARGNWPIITPDLLLKGAKVAIEVDTAFTHTNVENDRFRNKLLADVGWTTVRLRLGGLGPLGEHDVTTESDTPTVAVVAALVEAVGDAVAGRAGQVRHVPKAIRPAREPAPKSRLGAVAAHQYVENGHYVSWTLNSGEVLRLVAMDSGHYLAAQHGHDAPWFVKRLSLDGIPRKQWRGQLLELLGSMDDSEFHGVSRYPWGDELFVGVHASAVNVYGKFQIGCTSWDATANIEGADSATATAFMVGSEIAAELHPEAQDAGWTIGSFSAVSGYRGEFQRFELVRTSRRRGHWATSVDDGPEVG